MATADFRASGNGNGVAVVNRANLTKIGRLDDVIDERFQVGTGHTGICVEALLFPFFDEFFRVNHTKEPAATRSSTLSTSSQWPVVYST